MLQIARSEAAARLNGKEPPLVEQPPALNCEVCVIVPVRDEAKTLEATLTALAEQVDLDGNSVERDRYEVIVLANNCSDNSAAIARRFARRSALVLHVVEVMLEAEYAYIGWVRKRLMDEAYRRLAQLGRAQKHSPGIIASTDGDTQVTPTWIATILQEIQRGADAVGGRILTNPRERAALDRVTRLYFLRYVGYRSLVAQLEAILDPVPYDPIPRHHQHFGANLAVTAATYAQVGGLPSVRTPEDVAFYQALTRADARFRHSPDVQVITSARVVGRIQDGLAGRLTQLARLGHAHQPMLVESAALVETRYWVRRQLRLLWQRRDTTSVHPPLAQALSLTTDWLREAIAQSPTFGWLVEHIAQQQPERDYYLQHWPLVPIQEAIAELRLIKAARADDSLESLEQIKPILLVAPPI
ncbi:MAG: glycosyltransferase [Cyanophyceae cyanobacterium]